MKGLVKFWSIDWQAEDFMNEWNMRLINIAFHHALLVEAHHTSLEPQADVDSLQLPYRLYLQSCPYHEGSYATNGTTSTLSHGPSATTKQTSGPSTPNPTQMSAVSSSVVPTHPTPTTEMHTTDLTPSHCTLATEAQASISNSLSAASSSPIIPLHSISTIKMHYQPIPTPHYTLAIEA